MVVMEVLDDSLLTEVSCPHYSLPLKHPHTPSQNEPWEKIFLEILQMEPEVQIQLLQNRPCGVSKPGRFQGTLSLREF